MCFFYGPHSTARVFSTYQRLGKRLKSNFLSPTHRENNAYNKSYCQAASRCSISLKHCGAGGLGGGGKGVQTFKTNHISKWLTSHTAFGCWQDDPGLEYKEVAPSLTKQDSITPNRSLYFPPRQIWNSICVMSWMQLINLQPFIMTIQGREERYLHAPSLRGKQERKKHNL